MRNAPTLLFVTIVLLTGGCDDSSSSKKDSRSNRDGGAGDGGTDGSVSATSIADYCAARGDLYFDYLQYCYGEQPYPESYRKEFVDRRVGRCLNSEDGVAAGRLSFDGQRATSCLAAIDPTDCSTAFQHKECDGIFQGRSKAGDDCYREESLVFLVGVSSCVGGTCVEDNACPGTCVDWPKRGEACLDQNCSDEDYCDENDKCVARKEAGESCAGGERCEEGTVCVNDSETCVELADSGDEDCTDKVCNGPSACVDGKCVSRSKLGEACALSSNCPTGSVCRDKVCKARAGVGQFCDFDAHCQVGLLCGDDTKKCIEFPKDGESCVKGKCAEGTSCRYGQSDGDNGTCRTLVAEGGACLVNGIPDFERCADGVFCVAAGTCEKPGEKGDPCAAPDTRTCKDGLWCDRATKTCAEPAGQDDACNPSWANACGAGLACVCTAGDRETCGTFTREPQAHDVCKPALVDGEKCFRDGECVGGCEIDLEAPITTKGTCVAIGADQCLP